MKKFALVGAAGFIAPRHMNAIKATGNDLVAALDNSDCVGIMDSYFPGAAFFTEFERFDRHIDKLKRANQKIDFITICSPNYLHDSHARFGLRAGCDVICEKPVVLNPWNVDALEEIENETGKKVSCILQLRNHPAIIALKRKIQGEKPTKKYDIDLTYLTSRGIWYHASWKGNEMKSGGIATNIGIHFFDMLTWIFGPVQSQVVHLRNHDRASGFMELKNARVRWFLSINENCLPPSVAEKGFRTYRSITIDKEELEFSEGFADLHTQSYEQVLSGNGFGLSDSRNAIDIVHNIRKAEIHGLSGDYHPMAKLPLSSHPFLK